MFHVNLVSFWEKVSGIFLMTKSTGKSTTAVHILNNSQDPKGWTSRKFQKVLERMKVMHFKVGLIYSLQSLHFIKHQFATPQKKYNQTRNEQGCPKSFEESSIQVWYLWQQQPGRSCCPSTACPVTREKPMMTLVWIRRKLSGKISWHII